MRSQETRASLWVMRATSRGTRTFSDCMRIVIRPSEAAIPILMTQKRIFAVLPDDIGRSDIFASTTPMILAHTTICLLRRYTCVLRQSHSLDCRRVAKSAGKVLFVRLAETGRECPGAAKYLRFIPFSRGEFACGKGRLMCRPTGTPADRYDQLFKVEQRAGAPLVGLHCTWIGLIMEHVSPVALTGSPGSGRQSGGG